MREGRMREGQMREGECSMGFIRCFRVMERPWPGIRDGRRARFAVRRRDREPGCRLVGTTKLVFHVVPECAE